MVDYFALLSEPRRPWLEPEHLKQRFLSLSSLVHPDRVHQGSEAERASAHQQYAQLNAAYQCLRSEKTRLAHFLELERGAKPRELQAMPGDLMNLSLEVGQLCREADLLIAQKSSVTSPLLKVRQFELCQSTTEKLQTLHRRITPWRAELLEELKLVDAHWTAGGNCEPVSRTSLLERMEQLYRLFGFLGRWTEQLQERIAQLSF